MNARPIPTDSILPPGSTVLALGPAHSFSDKAAQQVVLHSRDCTITLLSDIDEVLDTLGDAEGRSVHAVVPISNSSSSVVSDHFECLREGPGDGRMYGIAAMVRLQIDICLGTLPGVDPSRDIRQVYSHAMGIAQCSNELRDLRRTLRRQGGTLESIGMKSTSAAAQFVGKDQDPAKAALASRPALVAAGLEVQERKMTNAARRNRLNTTTFAVCYVNGRDANLDYRKRFHALLFTPKDRPGVLDEILHPIAEAGHNLRAIHSLPVGTASGGDEYTFYLEMEHQDPDAFAAVMERLRDHPDMQNVAVLGSWDHLLEA